MILINGYAARLTLQALNRLTYYHTYLKKLHSCGELITTATAIAEALGINEVVVRKDLSVVRQEKGRPNTGFSVDEMIERIEDCLGYNNVTEAVLVGVGSMGRTLISGIGIERLSLHVVAGFDTNRDIIGTTYSGVDIFPMGKFTNLCQRLHIQVGIIAVPEQVAQAVCNLMVASGIRYILNYAQVFLAVPDNVYVQNENPAASLLAFSHHIRNTSNE